MFILFFIFLVNVPSCITWMLIDENIICDDNIHLFLNRNAFPFMFFPLLFFYSLTIKWLKPWLTLNGFCIFPLILMIKPFLLYFSFILFFFTKMMLHQLFYFLVFKMIHFKNKMFILFYLPFFNFHTWITWNLMTKFSIFF